MTDCLSVFRSAKGGLRRAESEKRPWAPVWRYMSWNWDFEKAKASPVYIDGGVFDARFSNAAQKAALEGMLMTTQMIEVRIAEVTVQLHDHYYEIVNRELANILSRKGGFADGKSWLTDLPKTKRRSHSLCSCRYGWVPIHDNI